MCRPQETIMHDWWMAAVAARFGHIVYLDEALGTYSHDLLRGGQPVS